MLAVIALASTVAWRIAAPSRWLVVSFILLGIAACSGVAVAMWIIGPMEKLRADGLGGSDQFKRLHGYSMMLYVTQAGALLISGISLVLAMQWKGAETSHETAGARGSPA